MLGDSVSINQALVVTVFSMLIVFATLYIISLILSGFKSAFYKDKSKKKEKPKENINLEQKKNVNRAEKVEDKTEEETEIVAVITAALAQSLSVLPADIRIKAISRIPQTAPVWAVAGRQKQVSNKL